MAFPQAKPTFAAYFNKMYDSVNPAYDLSQMVHPKQVVSAAGYIQLAQDLTVLDPLRTGIVHRAEVQLIQNGTDHWLIVPTPIGTVGILEDGNCVWWDPELTKHIPKYFREDAKVKELELLVKLGILTGARIDGLINYVARCHEMQMMYWHQNKRLILSVAQILTGEYLLQELS